DSKAVAQALTQYLQNPNHPQLANAMRNWRIQVADSFSLLRADQLPFILSSDKWTDLWPSYELLRKANLRNIPLADLESKTLARAKDRFSQKTGPDALGPLIALTLFLDTQKIENRAHADLSLLSPTQRALVES